MTETPPTPGRTIAAAAPRLAYVPGLDGLRAIAVAGVLLYHAGVGWLPGGFLGVDVFFVISGFLITALLLAERDATGSIDLRAFWLRRARRLLPALFVVLLASLAFAVAFLPDSVARLRADAAAAAAYVTNWYLVAGDQSYFDAIDRQSPLLHLWSLAVEEQFYLVWPVLLALVLRFLRRPGALAVAVLGAAASAVWMSLLFEPQGDPSRVYYGTDTRLAGPLIGAALALALSSAQAVVPCRRAARIAVAAATDMAALVAVGVLAWFALSTGADESTLYLGGLVLVWLASAVLVGAVVYPSSLVVPWLLERSPLRWLGTRSYGIYLWHWPIFSVTRPGLDVALDGLPLLIVRLALTAVVAEVSYRLVERPVRRGALERSWRRLHAEPGLRHRHARLRLATGLGAAVLPASALAMAVLAATPPDRPDYLPVDGYAGVVVVERGQSDRPAATPSPEPGSVRSAVRPHETAPPPRPPLVIGDSIIVATGTALARQLGTIELDAEVGRHVIDGVAILERRRAEGRLPEVVIIDLGTNGPMMRAQFERAMEVLEGTRLVVWVNVTVPRSWEGHTNLVLEQQVPRYPNARLVDWHAASAGRPELFRADGYHPTPDGAAIFAALIAEPLR